MMFIPKTAEIDNRSGYGKMLRQVGACPRKGKAMINRLLNRIDPRIELIFFILSTGRAGSNFLSYLLDHAKDATVEHQPAPGAESINHVGLDLYLHDKNEYERIQVDDFKIMSRHARLYLGKRDRVYGDGYNSIYPFALALKKFYDEKGIESRFLHLIRHPETCCKAILRAEGPYGPGKRRNFGTRAPYFREAPSPIHAAVKTWITINEVIDYQIARIEEISPGSTRLVQLENLNDVDYSIEIFEWLGLDHPGERKLQELIENRESNPNKNSYKKWLDSLGVPEANDQEVSIIRALTGPYLEKFGYTHLCDESLVETRAKT